MSIATLADLKAALPGRSFGFRKGCAQFAGTWPGWITSGWINAGLPAAASNPPSGAGEVPTNATAGAIPIVNPGGSNTLYLARFRAIYSSLALSAVDLYPYENYVWLMDRLVHTSGLSGTSTAAQTVNSASVNRPDSAGTGAMLFVEAYTQLGGTATTATISYTNQAGTSGRTASAAIASFFGPSGALQYSLTPASLQAGDTGVRSVQTLTLAASTGIAGNFGITIARPVAACRVQKNIDNVQDHFAVGLPVIPSSACLFVAFANGNGLSGSSGASQTISGEIVTVEG